MKKTLKNLLIFTVILFILSNSIILFGSIAKSNYLPFEVSVPMTGVIILAASLILCSAILIQVVRSN